MSITFGIIAYVAVFILTIGGKLMHDYHAKNVEHRIIDHTKSAIEDTSIFIAAALLIFVGLTEMGLYTAVGAVGLALSFRWILFDILFNIANGDKWDHTGKSSSMDRALAKYGQWLKLLPLIISIIILGFLG